MPHSRVIAEASPDAAEPALSEPAAGVAIAPTGSASVFLKNSIANVARIGLTSVVAILLPGYLTHHLPTKVYGAWVLILQLGAYVGYLNLGVQTALAKFIAEYDARNDLDGCGRCASVGLRVMLFASVLGVVLTGLLAWDVPMLFRDMPLDLLHDVRVSVCLVGLSLSVGLASSVFSAIFLGLQRYHVPMVTGVATRIVYGAAICAAVWLHSSLIAMAAIAATVNLLTALTEVIAWRQLASQVRVSLLVVDRDMIRRMVSYCALLTVWTVCMLFISGLDIAIVGHYAFDQVAFYSIANAPTNLILTVVSALLGPLLPATSAYSVNSTPQKMGNLLMRTTRYGAIVLFVSGLPIMVLGYALLRLWVGPVYASHSFFLLHILLAANILRNLGAPYSTMVVATSRQRAGTASAITEALVNLTASILLARHLGALGVALGTLIGAVTSLAMHFGISMHYTRKDFAISRGRLFLGGVLRPAVMAVPSLLLASLWWNSAPAAMGPGLWSAWAFSTAALAWWIAMTAQDRQHFQDFVRSRLSRFA